jgi:hypothetical protein
VRAQGHRGAGPPVRGRAGSACGGGRKGRGMEGERGRGRGELTSGSKSGDHHLQNLGHNEGERGVEERKLLRGKKLNEEKGREGRGRVWGGAGARGPRLGRAGLGQAEPG